MDSRPASVPPGDEDTLRFIRTQDSNPDRAVSGRVSSSGGPNPPGANAARVKVPQEITQWFWYCKVASTTVGETLADYLNETVGLGLPKTTGMMSGILAFLLIVQVLLPRYNPAWYWLTVVFTSITGTLITDSLTDGQNYPLWKSTCIFTSATIVAFTIWWWSERTLDIHSIYTRRREIIYWIAILMTFACGTAVGDFISEQANLGYGYTLLVFVAPIAVLALLWYFKRINNILVFWLVYILTRPLGASIGDFTSQPDNQGQNVGTTDTSLVLLALIIFCVGYLMVTRRDQVILDGNGDRVEHRAFELAGVLRWARRGGATDSAAVSKTSPMYVAQQVKVVPPQPSPDSAKEGLDV